MKKRLLKSFWFWLFLLLGLLSFGYLYFNRPLPDWPKTPSYAIQAPESTTMGKIFQPHLEAHPKKNAFLLLESGLDAFAARMILAQRAEKSLDVQYYIFHGDDTGRLFINELLTAADRGVRVRLLVDDLKSFGYEEAALDLSAHPNFEIRFFNPFRYRGAMAKWLNYLFEQKRMDHRMHNKVFIADNLVGVVGGRNIGDEYFEAQEELSFNDLDIIFAGPETQKASQSFDDYWNSPLAAPAEALFGEGKKGNLGRIRTKLMAHQKKMKDSIYLQHLKESSLWKKLSGENPQVLWAPGVFVADPPDKALMSKEEFQKHRLAYQVSPVVEAGQAEFLVLSPYFVPRQAGVEFIKQLRDKGMKVRILTNSLISNDVGIVHSGYVKYRKPLLKMGVKLFELKPTEQSRQYHGIRKLTESSPSSLHAKTFVVDRERLFVGSMNLDPRAVVQNTESGILVQSPELAGQIASQIEILSQPKNSYQVLFHSDYYKEKSDPKKQEDLVWVTQSKEHTLVFEKEPHTSWWDRAVLKVFGWLPIEGRI